MSQFSQLTKKIPPSFDGETSWFAYEDALDDWCDITELDDEKRGPALRNKLEGDAAIYKKMLSRENVKSKEDGVTYFKRTLRPFFVKVSVNVFLYRFQLFMSLRRGSSNLMKWMSRFQIQLKRLEEAWNPPHPSVIQRAMKFDNTQIPKAATPPKPAPASPPPKPVTPKGGAYETCRRDGVVGFLATGLMVLGARSPLASLDASSLACPLPVL